MLQRNLLYTAITRGRKLVVLVGSRKALWRAVTNFETKTRCSLLKWRLQQPDKTGPIGPRDVEPAASLYGPID